MGYRRSRFHRSARACGGAAARRTVVSWEAIRARGTGRLLPVKADLVARTVPLLSLHSNVANRYLFVVFPLRARSRLNAALMSDRCVNACGKLPSASPLGPVSSE